MAIINQKYLCPNCQSNITITRDDSSTIPNFIICPDCKKNIFPNVKDATAVVNAFNDLKEL
jgi:DNA-directed RNA polymerase subunit RPC12/RpoP